MRKHEAKNLFQSVLDEVAGCVTPQDKFKAVCTIRQMLYDYRIPKHPNKFDRIVNTIQQYLLVEVQLSKLLNDIQELAERGLSDLE